MTAVGGLGRIWTLRQMKFVQNTLGADVKILNLLKFCRLFYGVQFLDLGMNIFIWKGGAPDVREMGCPVATLNIHKRWTS